MNVSGITVNTFNKGVLSYFLSWLVYIFLPLLFIFYFLSGCKCNTFSNQCKLVRIFISYNEAQILNRIHSKPVSRNDKDKNLTKTESQDQWCSLLSYNNTETIELSETLILEIFLEMKQQRRYILTVELYTNQQGKWSHSNKIYLAFRFCVLIYSLTSDLNKGQRDLCQTVFLLYMFRTWLYTRHENNLTIYI